MIFAGDGNVFTTESPDADLVRCGNGNDTAHGEGGSDSLFGDNGDDWLIGGLGMNTVDGGAGTTSPSAIGSWRSTTPVTASLVTGRATFGTETDTLVNIENLAGTAADDSLTGNGSVNALFGSGGSDWLQGGRGADRLEGGAGKIPRASPTTEQLRLSHDRPLRRACER